MERVELKVTAYVMSTPLSYAQSKEVMDRLKRAIELICNDRREDPGLLSLVAIGLETQ